MPAGALSWAELARRAARAPRRSLGDGGMPGVLGRRTATSTRATPRSRSAAHIAAVEVDLDTGRSRVVRHVAVDDCGTVLNPLLVEGQQHGGIASGIGQALYEEVRFDDDGNPLTSNLADYGMPSAAELPSFEVHSTETPTPLNPLGAKGIGEAATIGSTPAVQNAVIDALAHLGVRHLDMPCTSERVWRAITRRRGRHAPRPVARPAGDLRDAARRRGRRRGGPRRRRRHLTHPASDSSPARAAGRTLSDARSSGRDRRGRVAVDGGGQLRHELLDDDRQARAALSNPIAPLSSPSASM